VDPPGVDTFDPFGIADYDGVDVCLVDKEFGHQVGGPVGGLLDDPPVSSLIAALTGGELAPLTRPPLSGMAGTSPLGSSFRRLSPVADLGVFQVQKLLGSHCPP
jgi:hypothetical protein